MVKAAEVRSYDGLHSKVAVIDKEALIGSANLSHNAGVNTCEASLLTDDLQVVGLIQSFIEQLKNESVPVNEQFLIHIERLPVTQKGGMARKRTKKIDIGESRLWLAATRPLSDKLAMAEEASHLAGMDEAQKHASGENYEVQSFRWNGKSRFRSQAKPGDLVIETHTQRRGNRKFVEVYRAVPILLRTDDPKWTRFYVEIPPDHVYYSWKNIKSFLASLGIRNVKPNSTLRTYWKSRWNPETHGVAKPDDGDPQIARKSVGRNPLKAIDEFNYCKYSRQWIEIKGDASPFASRSRRFAANGNRVRSESKT